MKFIDICSGIGGFRTALERHGHECVAFAEIDKFAKQSYRAIYDTENEEELNDITTITDEHFRRYRGQIDIITGGFPCQTFSIAGKRRGFEDTRGTIFFHIARAIKEIQPSYVLLENVKGLLSHDKGRTYGTIVQALDELGYFVEWGVFNSKYWGVPQNRERVYILVTRKDVWKEPKLFKLLKQQTNVDTRLIDILETNVDESYYLSEEKTKKLTLNEDLSGKLNKYDYLERDRVHSVNKVSPTLNTMQGGDRQPKIAVKDFKEIVKVRKYDIDKEKLKNLLKDHKTLSNKEISEKLKQPITKVEHWFRSDNSFSVPDPEVWFDLKELLNIKTDEFDKQITTFVEKESGFDTTNRVYDVKHISPTLNTKNEPKVAIVGNTSNTHHNAHNVHDVNGLSPTIAVRDYKGAKQIAMPVLTPDRVNKRQNGRRFKDNDEPMFTLTSQDRHGIAIREATKKGYAEAMEGDSVNTSFPNSKTRRGRVGKQVAQTLQAGEVNQGVVTKDIRMTEDGFHTYRKDAKKSSIQGTHVTYEEGKTHALTSNHVPMTLNNLRIRKLTPLECWRLQGFTDDQFYKAKDSGVSNSQLYKQAGNAVTVNVVDAIVGAIE
ncbi:DNA (cytosine-5-)-methyltransferase [Staphylococcus epidermidis]|uniref:DNA cytosine methyltransferase n=1 Tax=Staphylococcus epidermidis TaxID=1282 RepID=UPI003C7BE459